MRLTTLLLCLGLATSLSAQRVGLRFGYRATYAPMPHLNSTIDAYNDRTDVVTRMPDLHLLRGPAGAVGIQFGSLAFNLGVMTGHALAPSTLSDSLGQVFDNDLLVRSTFIRLEFAQFPEPGASFAFSFGLSADYGPVRLLQRTTGQPDVLLDKFNLLAATPSMQFYVGLAENLYLWLSPHYQFFIQRADLIRTHQLLVPNPTIDPGIEIQSKFDNFGILGGFMFSFGE